MTSPKSSRRPLVVRQPITGWINTETGEAPYVAIPHEEWILNRLAFEGETALRAATAVIAHADAEHFYRVETARGSRKKKGVRSELLKAMRRFRQRNPDPSLKAFISHAEGNGWLVIELVEGGATYTFNLESGEYILRSLDKLWAQAGSAG